MSRGPTVTMEFIADMAAAEQRYEAFVRKVSQPIQLNIGGSTANQSANAGVQSAVAPGTVTQPDVGRASAERNVTSSLERLAASINQQAVAGSQLSAAMQNATQALNQSSNLIGAGNAGVSGVASAQGAGGGNVVVNNYVNATSAASGATPATGAVAGTASAARSSSVNRIAKLHIINQAVLGAVESLQAFQKNQIENRLAVNDGGQVDLMRQFQADTDLADKVENAGGIGGRFGGIIREFFTGDREAAQRQIQRAKAIDTTREAQKAAGDFREDFARKVRVDSAQGAYPEAVEQADVNRIVAEKKARALRNATVGANQATGQYNTEGPDKVLAESIDLIQKDYTSTIKKISGPYMATMQRIKAETGVQAEREAGHLRKAALMEVEADIDFEVRAEQDPEMRRFKERRGKATIGAYKAEVAREESLQTAALQANVDITGLQSEGKPTVAKVESLYRNAVLAAKRDQDKPGDAALELQSGFNELQTLKRKLMEDGGSAVQVDAGAFGPSGTQGRGTDDTIEALHAIDQREAQILDELKKLNATFSGTP